MGDPDSGLSSTVGRYNTARPIGASTLACPPPTGAGTCESGPDWRIDRVDVLGGPVQEFRHAA
jgi:hypothetical protein